MRSAIDEKIAEQAAMRALGILSRSEVCWSSDYSYETLDTFAEELAAFDAVVSALALGAPEKIPSPQTRNRLLDLIAD